MDGGAVIVLPIRWIPRNNERGSTGVIDFLEKFRYLAVVLVALSIPAFGFIAFIAMLFCDAGPLSTCVRFAACTLGVPIVQAASLVTGWIFLRRRRYLPVSACLMIFSVLPPLGLIWFLIVK
jgi:hypothetical protein